MEKLTVLPRVKVNSDIIWFTIPTVETSETIIVDEQESKIKTQTENIGDSILSNNLSKVESNVVSHMDKPKVKINLDSNLVTVSTIETAKAIQVDDP